MVYSIIKEKEIELFQNTTTILKRGSDNGRKEVQSAREYVD